MASPLPKDFPKIAKALGVLSGDVSPVTGTHTLASMCGQMGKKISQFPNVRTDRQQAYRAELESNVRDLRRACERIRAEIDRLAPDRPEDERRDLAINACRRMVRGVTSARLRRFAESPLENATAVIDGLLADRARPNPTKRKRTKSKNASDCVPAAGDEDDGAAASTIIDQKLARRTEAATATPEPSNRERAYLAAEEFVRAMDATTLGTDRSIDEATRACGEAYRALVEVLDGRHVTECVRAPAALVPALVNDRLYATAAAVLRGHCVSLVAMADNGVAFDDAYERTTIRPLQFYAALSGRQLPGDATAPTETGLHFNDPLENGADVLDIDAGSESEAPDLWLARAGYVAVPLSSATDAELEALKFDVRGPPFPETEPSSIGFTAADLAAGCRGKDRDCFGWLYRDAESGEPAGAVLMRRARFAVPMPNDAAATDLPYAVPPWNDPASVETLEVLKIPVVYAGDTWLERCIVTHAMQAAQAINSPPPPAGETPEATNCDVRAWCARLPVTRIPAKSTYVVDTRRAAFWHKHFKMSRCFPFKRFDDPVLAGVHFARHRPSVYGDDDENDEAPTMLRPLPSERQLASFARAAIADQPIGPDLELDATDSNDDDDAKPMNGVDDDIPEPDSPGQS